MWPRGKVNCLHVEQTEETESKSEAQRVRTVSMVLKRGVVELKFFEGIAKFTKIVGRGGVQPAKDDGEHLFVAW